MKWDGCTNVYSVMYNKQVNFHPQGTVNPRSTTFVCLPHVDFQAEVDKKGICFALVAHGHVDSPTLVPSLPPQCQELLSEFEDVLVDESSSWTSTYEYPTSN